MTSQSPTPWKGKKILWQVTVNYVTVILGLIVAFENNLHVQCSSFTSKCIQLTCNALVVLLILWYFNFIFVVEYFDYVCAAN